MKKIEKSNKKEIQNSETKKDENFHNKETFILVMVSTM